MSGKLPFKEAPPLSDDIIETVRQLNDDSESIQFALGDFLVEVTDELETTYDPYSLDPKAAILTLICNRTGSTHATLRDRERVARKFPKDVREKYPYTWGQFRALGKAGEKWQEYADYFLDHLPAPVSVIQEKIRKDKTGEPQWVQRFETFSKLAQQLIGDEEAPDYVKRCARSCMLSIGIAFGEHKKSKHFKMRHNKK